MATSLLGIDLGSYSVKVARLEAGFRSVALVGLYELRLPEPTHEASPSSVSQPGEQSESTSSAAQTAPEGTVHSLEEPHEELLARQMQALEQLLGEIRTKGESSAVGVAKDMTLRIIELPLSDPKKVQQALPFELAGQLMTDLDEQLVDQTLVRVSSTPPGGGEAGSLWLAACVPKEEVREQLRWLLARHLDPRVCGATALATAALFVTPPGRRRDKPAEPGGDGELAAPALPAWVIDFGHRYTHVCAVDHHPTRPGQVVVPFARSIARGGLQLTQAVARAHGTDLGRAEALKHEIGLDEGADRKTAVAVREALRPLLRELRQTLAAYSARQGERPRLLYLCGGGSELHGLYELLQNELDIEVMPLAPPHQAPWFSGRESQKSPLLSASMSADSSTLHRGRMPTFAMLRRFACCAPAIGLALALFQPVPQVNFRKGELSFRTDWAFLREKAPYLLAFLVTLFLCAGGWVAASLHVAGKESERLRLRLISETTALFGEPRTDGASVSSELQSVLREDKGDAKRIPQVSVLDLLEDISHAAPTSSGSGAANLDVLDLSIRAKKIEIKKATAASAQYVEDFAAALAKISCVKSVQKNKVITVKNPGPDGKPVDVKQFSVELTTTCP